MSVDLLQEEDNDFRVINFFPVESFRGTFFRWTSGNRALVKGKGTGIVKVHLLIPTEHTELKIRLGSLSHNITALQPWFRFQIDLTAETEDWELEFEVDRWNHHKAEIAEGDSRALSLLFEKLHFLRSLDRKSTRLNSSH